MAQINFDASNVAPDPGKGDPIPLGWYNMAAEKTEVKPTSGGTGSYLEAVFGVLDGPHQGRKVYHNFNTVNANPQTVEIAYKQLSAWMHAVNHLRCGDSSELHGKPFKARVKIRAAEGQYDARNEIAAFKNVNDPTAVNSGAAAVVAPVAPGGWAPPAMPPMPPQAPPQQQWAPPPAAAPVGPPPGWQPPAVAPPAIAAPAAAPQWAPPPGAPAQPWAAPAPAPVAPPVQGPPIPAPGPAQWAPPPVAGAAPAGVAVPPWMNQGPPAA